MVLAKLNRSHRQREQLAAPKTTANKQGQHCIVPFASEIRAGNIQQQATTLIGCEPVAPPYADPANAFDATDARRKLRAE